MTGATPEQIDAAMERWIAEIYPNEHERAIFKENNEWRPDNTFPTMAQAIRCLVPDGYAIIDEKQIAAIGRVLRFVDGAFIDGADDESLKRDWDILAAIGGQQG